MGILHVRRAARCDAQLVQQRVAEAHTERAAAEHAARREELTRRGASTYRVAEQSVIALPQKVMEVATSAWTDEGTRERSDGEVGGEVGGGVSGGEGGGSDGGGGEVGGEGGGSDGGGDEVGGEVGGDGDSGGGGLGGVMYLEQIMKPPLVTEPSVRQVNVEPTAMGTPEAGHALLSPLY